MFGENYCNGTTFSSFPLDGGAPTFGNPTTNAETFQLAIARFDSALAIAPTGSDVANLARVGKGRALLDLGQFAAAGTAVAGVPSSFEYAVPYSSNSSDQENGVWTYTVDARRYNVSNNEGGSGLPYRTLGIRTDSASKGGTDPRVSYRNGPGRSFDTSIGTLWAQQKYPSRDSDIPLATGAEARLIQAEAALQASPATFITLLNQANVAAGGTGTLTDPGAAGNARASLLFKERGFSLWLTAHRLSDERRMMRQYNFTEAQSFPTGTTAHGDPYGTDKNLPIFIDEANNPNFAGCTDRNP
jgi:starch-binding outer membrane protein, SusD/RagB family